MTYIEDAKTLTDISLKDAYEQINKNLGEAAYSKVPGGANLTSIKAAYQWDLMTELYGPCGIGWSYTIDEWSLEGESSIARISLIFGYYNKDRWVKSEPIQALGGSKNKLPGDQLKGAVTDALGKAMSMLGMQRFVYMDEAPPNTTTEPATPGNVDNLEDAQTLVKQQLTALGKEAATEFKDHCISETGNTPSECTAEALVKTFSDWRKTREA